MTSRSGSTKRRFSRNQTRAVATAMSPTGTCSPFTTAVARSPKIRRIGSRTRPPPAPRRAGGQPDGEGDRDVLVHPLGHLHVFDVHVVRAQDGADSAQLTGLVHQPDLEGGR